MLAAARLHERLDQAKEASAMYERLLAIAREDNGDDREQLDTIRYEWSWVLRKTGDIAQADALLKEIHAAQPRGSYWADATFRLAERASQTGNLDEAARLVAQVLAARPGAELLQHALYLQTQVAARQENWKQVAPSAQRLVDEFPRGSLRLPADYWLAESAYRQGEFDEAGRLFAELSGRAEGRTDAWLAMVPLRRAQVLAQAKNWDEAQEMAAGISRQWPDFAQQYEADYLIGRCLGAQASFNSARDAYRRVVESKSGAKTETAAMAQWMIGETHFHQKNYDLARREYLKVDILYKYPRWQAAALLQAGKCSEQLGDATEAIRLYERLVEQYPDTEFTAECQQRLKAMQARTARKPAQNQ
jgi:TolA-binding protein